MQTPEVICGVIILHMYINSVYLIDIVSHTPCLFTLLQQLYYTRVKAGCSSQTHCSCWDSHKPTIHHVSASLILKQYSDFLILNFDLYHLHYLMEICKLKKGKMYLWWIACVVCIQHTHTHMHTQIHTCTCHEVTRYHYEYGYIWVMARKCITFGIMSSEHQCMRS